MSDATPPYGGPPAPQQAYPQPYPPPVPPAAYAPHGYQPALAVAYGHDPDRRPGTVTAAAVIAIAVSGLVLICALVLVVVGALGSDVFLDSFREGSDGAYDNVSDTSIEHGLVVAGALMGAWCLAAVVLGIFVLRRSNVARVLLVISAVVAALVSLVGILSGVAVIPLLGSITAVVLLFVGGANDWFHPRVPQPAAPQPPW